MINLIKNFISLIVLFRIFCKHQIFLNPQTKVVPFRIRMGFYALCLLFAPSYLFKKPTKLFPERLVNFFQELGPIYIKFGQTLSTRADLMGNDVAGYLRQLQDQLSPFDFHLVKEKIEQDFGQPVERLFSSFTEQPVAAASIAQVHKAILITGEEVAVKILRPNIHKIYKKDICFLEFVGKIVVKFIPKAKRFKLHEVVRIFRKSMDLELDLRLEAAAASRFSDNFVGDDTIYIPKIYWHLVSEEIATLEWVEGVSIYDKDRLLEHGLDLDDIASKIAVIFLNQAFRDGFFHADLHPGNIIVKPSGQIALIDFGIVGVLAEKDRLGIAEILYGFLKRDYKLVAEVHKRIGYIPLDSDLEYFAQSCRAITEPILGKKIENISIGNLLAQLFKVSENFNMDTQPQLLLLQKTMVVVEGIGQILDPKANMWQLAEPWIKKWAAKNLTPEAKLLRFLKRMVDKIK